MDRSMLSAVSGIEASQTYMDVVGNNIANLNTNGFKSQSGQFADLLSQQLAGGGAPSNGYAGVNPMSVGSGVRMGAVTTNLSEGSLVQTGQPADVAIQGSGYLVASQGGQNYFTRNGHLTLDANGNLATSTGALIQGWQAAGGVINTNATAVPLTIPTGQTVPATATSTITMAGNLPAWNGTGTAVPQTTTITGYDGLGNKIPVTITMTPTSTADQWTLSGTVPGTGSTPTQLWPGGGPTVTFDTKTGQISSFTGTGVSTQPDGSFQVTTSASPTGPLALLFAAPGSSTALTQYASPGTFVAQSQNGGTSGTLASYSIGSDGIITGSFTNGTTQKLGQLALASFANPGGLVDTGSLMYQTSPNSGRALIGIAGSAGRGTLIGGSLEASNVDLARQLTDLITAQEAYQANSKVITTSSQTIQALMQVP